MNPMKKIILAKLTLNIGAGESGPKLEKAKQILEKIADKKVVITRTYKRTTFGMTKGRPIGVKVTLRGKPANELLEKLFKVVDNRLKITQFDPRGNFAFGIDEYINIPGIRYDPDVGILGMDVCVTLARPGFRIKDRRIKRKKIGSHHLITQNEAAEFVKREFNVEITKGTKVEEI